MDNFYNGKPLGSLIRQSDIAPLSTATNLQFEETKLYKMCMHGTHTHKQSMFHGHGSLFADLLSIQLLS